MGVLNRGRGAALSLVGIVACGSDSPSPTHVESTKANPCATPGATYSVVLVEQSGGTCGPIPDDLVNVREDGTLPGPPMSCQSISITGCGAKLNSCWASAGCAATTSITFASDGSSAKGAETLSCSEFSKCISTYAVTWTRSP